MGSAALLLTMLSAGVLLSAFSGFNADDDYDDDAYTEDDSGDTELTSDQLLSALSEDMEDPIPEASDTADHSTHEVTDEHGSPQTESDLELTPIILTTDDDDFEGTSADEHIIGGKGDDTINGNGGTDLLDGWGGDDEIISHGSGGRLAGNQGDDYLEAKKTSFGQYHIFGADGADTIVMHLENNPGWGHQGFHAHGGEDADEFRFVGAGTTNAPMISRIEDFDPAVDSIWVDDEELDLHDLPSNMRIVNYHEQQWLVIDDNNMIGLEGARTSAPHGVPTMMESHEEIHFHTFPTDLASMPSVAFKR